MTTLIATISMLAALIGIAGIVPRLITMLRARSSSGCLTAVCLVRRFRRRAAEPAAEAVIDLRTQEFETLRDAVLIEHHRRTRERELALA